jgi:hypothetical protein
MMRLARRTSLVVAHFLAPHQPRAARELHTRRSEIDGA